MACRPMGRQQGLTTMKASDLLKYLPSPDANATGHRLGLNKVYRSYKNSPHNVDALYLKYLVHRLENGEKYNSASPLRQRGMDIAFLRHHQKGKAAEKNGHINADDLKRFIQNPDTVKLAKQLINHKQKLNNFILKEHPDHIVDINGEPHLRLTRGLGVNREERGEEHALASYADQPDPPFGGVYHHQFVPLKNIWYTYDYGPKETSWGKIRLSGEGERDLLGPQNEFLVSPHKVVYNENHEAEPTKQILVREHHKLVADSPKFASFRKNFKNLPPEIQEIAEPSNAGKIQKSFKQLTEEYERLTKADAPVKINPEHGRIIADAYHNMKHDPNHPEVKAAYNALINETNEQYKNLLQQGYKFTRITDPNFQPYKNSKEMHADIENNKHLYYYPTSLGFGSEDSHPKDHPLLTPTEFVSHDGEQMVANDILRQVHDINGHYHGGKTTFSPTGEHQSYLHHKKMYSTMAQPALANELTMQNSWVNFGPHGEHNRKNPLQTIFAPQKAGLVPDWVWKGKWHQ